MTTIYEAIKATKSKKVETAKKPAKEIAAARKNFSKMINKIVAISQNMKLTVKDWDKIDAGVRKGLSK